MSGSSIGEGQPVQQPDTSFEAATRERTKAVAFGKGRERSGAEVAEAPRTLESMGKISALKALFKESSSPPGFLRTFFGSGYDQDTKKLQYSSAIAQFARDIGISGNIAKKLIESGKAPLDGEELEAMKALLGNLQNETAARLRKVLEILPAERQTKELQKGIEAELKKVQSLLNDIGGKSANAATKKLAEISEAIKFKLQELEAASSLKTEFDTYSANMPKDLSEIERRNFIEVNSATKDLFIKGELLEAVRSARELIGKLPKYEDFYR
jgi:hypothetical protein